MPDLTHRSYEKEFLDRDDIPFEDIKRNMIELDIINTRLGGHAITIKGLQDLLDKQNETDKELFICEIGCGGGDNLRVLKKWMDKKDSKARFTGIDINKECVAFAKSQDMNKGICFIHSDYRQMYFDEEPDIIFSSLFCHHFTDEQLVEMMQWMQQNSKLGFFINDLHRHELAYYSIKAITSIVSKSYLVKNDAPLSVRRGFIKKEWEAILRAANILNFKIQWQWAFRWLITCRHDGSSIV